jgi:hypothetical protein
MQLELKDVKARIERLDRLARGLVREVRLQGGPEACGRTPSADYRPP